MTAIIYCAACVCSFTAFCCSLVRHTRTWPAILRDAERRFDVADGEARADMHVSGALGVFRPEWPDERRRQELEIHAWQSGVAGGERKRPPGDRSSHNGAGRWARDVNRHDNRLDGERKTHSSSYDVFGRSCRGETAGSSLRTGRQGLEKMKGRLAGYAELS
jgi:hypothetical protein